MKNEQGTALLWLLYIVLLFSLLGASLLKVAVTNLRVSGHLVAAEQAQYAAEAGVAVAEAVLPTLWREMLTEWYYEHASPPVFAVSVSQEEGNYRICAQGEGGKLTQNVEVLASVHPLGGQALYAKMAKLIETDVVGHLFAEEIIFSLGQSSIRGDLRVDLLELREGGTYHCTGSLQPSANSYNLEIDFAGLQAEALRCGWQVPAYVDDYYLIDGLQAGPIYSPSAAKISLDVPWKGMIAAADEVVITKFVPGSQVVVVAAADVLLDAAGYWPGSLFIYSATRISRNSKLMLEMNGCLVAPLLEVQQLRLVYNDEAVVSQLQVMPAELLLLSPTFTLEWLELLPRR